MNYHLNAEHPQGTPKATVRSMLALVTGEYGKLGLAMFAMLVNSAATFVGPFLMGRTIDRYVIPGDMRGVLAWAGILILVYVAAFAANYFQMMLMGMVGQRTLYRLRQSIFAKLQELPLAFFNANKSGDLIARINNDTDKLNQFFSEIAVRFVGVIVTLVGVAAFLVGINARLGLLALVPSAGILTGTLLLSKWIKSKTRASLEANGGLSGEVQESLDNFKVVIAFDRRDFFRDRFAQANERLYKAARAAGIASGTLSPIYEFMGVAAQLLVLVFGIAMIGKGGFTVGLLVSFLVYVNQFYSPLRQISYLWSGLQTALGASERISAILSLQTNLPVMRDAAQQKSEGVLSFDAVSFGYAEGSSVLSNINLKLEAGKTYALVGPTGGGKTTTASLMARLYDPTYGTVSLMGHDIRSYESDERASLIGFILQDPFLFAGTVQENIFYGNARYGELSDEEAVSAVKEAGLGELLSRFDRGLSTPVDEQAATLSLGQKQIIAFMRAVLRRPRILILDEATANIDTMTEAVLQEILDTLSSDTTRVIIAHRLNTIQNADEIFFVSGGSVTSAGSFDHALALLTGGSEQQ